MYAHGVYHGSDSTGTWTQALAPRQLVVVSLVALYGVFRKEGGGAPSHLEASTVEDGWGQAVSDAAAITT